MPRDAWTDDPDRTTRRESFLSDAEYREALIELWTETPA